MFWLENLPLANGNNSVSITATDAGGHSSMTNITVAKSSADLTIASVPHDTTLYDARVIVSGTVTPGYSVSVNGISATVNDGNWTAQKVPVHGKGTATFDAVAVSPGDTAPLVNASVEIEMPSMLRVVSYNNAQDFHDHVFRYFDWRIWTKDYSSQFTPDEHRQWLQTFTGNIAGNYGDELCVNGGVDFTGQWSDSDLAGFWHYIWDDDSSSSGTFSEMLIDPWSPKQIPDADLERQLPGGGEIQVHHYYADDVHFHWDWDAGYYGSQYRDVTVGSRTRQKLYTGGKAHVGRVSLFQVSASATQYFEPPNDKGHNTYPWVSTPEAPVPPTGISVMGQPLHEDGTRWVALSDNSEVDFDIEVPSADHYNAGGSENKYPQLDLDVDSDNRNGLEHSQAEDDIETQAPGKYIGINNGYADNDDIPDFADGYDKFGTAPAPSGTPNGSGQSAAFTPLGLTIPSGVDKTKAKIKFTYQASDPNGVQHSGDTYTPAEGGIRVWIKDGNQYRKQAKIDNYTIVGGYAVQDGDYVAPGEYWATNIPSGLYVEGIRSGQYSIKVELNPDGQSGYISSDEVVVTVVRVDIAMDGNRDTTIDFDKLADSKYLFWVNDDHDTAHYEEDQWHEDDSLNPSDGAGNPNWDDNHIGARRPQYGTTPLPHSQSHCRRDLEDFTRLHIKVDANLSQLPDVTYWMESSPSVNIFEAINEKLEYLTVGSVADQQIQKLRLLALNGGEVQLPNQYIKTGNQVSPFILEGCAAGKGDLTIIVKKDGNEICRKSVKLELREVTQFYQVFKVAAAGDITTTVSTGYNPDFTSSDDYLLLVHGFNMTDDDKTFWAGTAFKRLWWQGYKGHFGFFDWPCVVRDWYDLNPEFFDNSENIAWQCGAALLNRINQLNAGGHSGKVRLMAHSQGNIIAGEALRNAGGVVVQAYIASQAAVSGDHYQTGLPQNPTIYRILGFPIPFPTTPNVLANYPPTGTPYLSGVSNAVASGRLYDYFNAKDFALRKGTFSWERNNAMKPDLGYDYNDTDGNVNNYNWPSEYFHNGSDVLNFNDVANHHCYRIYAYAAESRTFAIGTDLVNGVFSGFDLESVTPKYDEAHYSHSRQFRSNIVDQKPYWERLKGDCRF